MDLFSSLELEWRVVQEIREVAEKPYECVIFNLYHGDTDIAALKQPYSKHIHSISIIDEPTPHAYTGFSEPQVGGFFMPPQWMRSLLFLNTLALDGIELASESFRNLPRISMTTLSLSNVRLEYKVIPLLEDYLSGLSLLTSLSISKVYAFGDETSLYSRNPKSLFNVYPKKMDYKPKFLSFRHGGIGVDLHSLTETFPLLEHIKITPTCWNYYQHESAQSANLTTLDVGGSLQPFTNAKNLQFLTSMISGSPRLKAFYGALESGDADSFRTLEAYLLGFQMNPYLSTLDLSGFQELSRYNCTRFTLLLAHFLCQTCHLEVLLLGEVLLDHWRIRATLNKAKDLMDLKVIQSECGFISEEDFSNYLELFPSLASFRYTVYPCLTHELEQRLSLNTSLTHLSVDLPFLRRNRKTTSLVTLCTRYLAFKPSQEGFVPQDKTEGILIPQKNNSHSEKDDPNENPGDFLVPQDIYDNPNTTDYDPSEEF